MGLVVFLWGVLVVFTTGAEFVSSGAGRGEGVLTKTGVYVGAGRSVDSDTGTSELEAVAKNIHLLSRCYTAVVAFDTKSVWKQPFLGLIVSISRRVKNYPFACGVRSFSKNPPRAVAGINKDAI